MATGSPTAKPRDLLTVRASRPAQRNARHSDPTVSRASNAPAPRGARASLASDRRLRRSATARALVRRLHLHLLQAMRMTSRGSSARRLNVRSTGCRWCGACGFAAGRPARRPTILYRRLLRVGPGAGSLKSSDYRRPSAAIACRCRLRQVRSPFSQCLLTCATCRLICFQRLICRASSCGRRRPM